VKIFGAQIGSIWEDPAATLERAAPLIRDAAGQGGSLICFPEQFATGWNPVSRLHVQDRAGSIVSTLRDLAREYGIAVLGSFREASGTGPRNVCIVVDRNGDELTSYAKCHLFSPAREDEYYVPGDAAGIFPLGGMSFGIAICYDLRFSGLFSAYARKGVHAMIVPAAWPASRISHWELFIRARALEHQMYVIGVNTTGRTPVDTYNGHSLASDPSGTVIAEAGSGETAFPVSLDRDTVDRTREAFPVARDRKPHLYTHLSLNGSAE
jgi:predicted amidohydrolase